MKITISVTNSIVCWGPWEHDFLSEIHCPEDKLEMIFPIDVLLMPGLMEAMTEGQVEEWMEHELHVP